MQVQHEYTSTFRPQVKKARRDGRWPDSVIRASRAATPATPRIIFCANSNLAESGEDTATSRGGLKKCWGSIRKRLTDHVARRKV
jgi:hypothetical protein